MFKNGFKRIQKLDLMHMAKLFTCFAFASTVYMSPVFGQQIILDGNTDTNISINANITNVSTKTIYNNNAFNSFHRLNVDKGNTVNLIVPSNANNLINLIHSEKSNINGILNSIKNGQVGGNIFLVNPYGITVGSQGVINVGSLTAVTPTTGFMNKFFKSKGNLNIDSVNTLLSGNAPIRSNAVIEINGKIRALENVKLDAGSIYNYGEISNTLNDKSEEISIADIVNITSSKEASEAILTNGEIILKATNDVITSGQIKSTGNTN
ncbi:MAG: leukotoxin LktA family filamentous adhesin, partial [Cyanobacteriota bacterium]